MLTVREEDMLEPIPIPIKALIPAISRDDKELQDLAEDLLVMGCEGLLAKPWNLKSEEILREFKVEKGESVGPHEEEGSGYMNARCME